MVLVMKMTKKMKNQKMKRSMASKYYSGAVSLKMTMRSTTLQQKTKRMNWMITTIWMMTRMMLRKMTEQICLVQMLLVPDVQLPNGATRQLRRPTTNQ
ncbi:unnamed protein product [Echinostoma caproni]|uniref:Ovule protein n=1 Tax=Echinostoma caproni TaxID=27848 RepID=A0A183ANH0_9TREM|nr:unnamed protein product [Echinostoma caproni]